MEGRDTETAEGERTAGETGDVATTQWQGYMDIGKGRDGSQWKYIGAGERKVSEWTQSVGRRYRNGGETKQPNEG
jgi:hypothetical protein